MKAALASLLLMALTGADQALAANELFPERVGAEWRFQSRAIPVSDPDDEPVYAETSLRIDRLRAGSTPDTRVFTIREHDGFTGRYRISDWEVSPAGVRIRGIEYPGPLASPADALEIGFLRFPLISGSRHDDGQWVTRTLGTETLTVPDGSGGWKPATAWKLHVIGTRLDPAGERDYTAVGNYWVVPGFGIARSELNAAGYYLDSEIIDVRGLR